MPTSRPPTEQIASAYQRLLAGQPDAPSDLIGLLLDPLIASLKRKFPTLPDPNMVVDIATDTLFRFVQEPGRFVPERGSLWNYLYMDALGDLRNAWQKEQRRQRHEVAFDPVAHDRADGNSDVEDLVVRRIAPEGLPTDTDPATVIANLREEMADERDWQVVQLMALGERKTSAYAEVLGVTELPSDAQRHIVKQAKDRLRLRLKRWGVKIK